MTIDLYIVKVSNFFFFFFATAEKQTCENVKEARDKLRLALIQRIHHHLTAVPAVDSHSVI